MKKTLTLNERKHLPLRGTARRRATWYYAVNLIYADGFHSEEIDVYMTAAAAKVRALQEAAAFVPLTEEERRRKGNGKPSPLPSAWVQVEEVTPQGRKEIYTSPELWDATYYC